MAQKSLIFISCGQYSPQEIELGKAIEQLIRDRTPYEPYFAEQAEHPRRALFIRIVKHDSDWSENQKRLYPGDRIEVFNLPYYVDNSNWIGGVSQREGQRSNPSVFIRVWSGDSEPWVTEIPISQLERF